MGTDGPSVQEQLDALLPGRSIRRVVGWVAVVVIALVCAWVAPVAANPGVQFTGSATGGYVSGTAFTMQAMDISTNAWPSATITAMGDMRGVTPAAAWIVTQDQADQFLAANVTSKPTTATDLLAAISAQGVPVASFHALPTTIPAGADNILLVVWQISDCDQAIAGEKDAMHVWVRSYVGTESIVQLTQEGIGIGPLWSDSRDDLKQSGIVCP